MMITGARGQDESRERSRPSLFSTEHDVSSRIVVIRTATQREDRAWRNVIECNYPARVVVLFTERHAEARSFVERRGAPVSSSERRFTASPFTARDLR
jgi:hypothetical protein